MHLALWQWVVGSVEFLATFLPIWVGIGRFERARFDRLLTKQVKAEKMVAHQEKLLTESRRAQANTLQLARELQDRLDRSSKNHDATLDKINKIVQDETNKVMQASKEFSKKFSNPRPVWNEGTGHYQLVLDGPDGRQWEMSSSVHPQAQSYWLEPLRHI